MMSMPIALAVILAIHANPNDGENYDAHTVELAMNEGVELDFPQFQELADVKILRGGATRDGQRLVICQASLVWKLNSQDFFAMLEKAMDKAFKQTGVNELTKVLGVGDFMGDLGKQALGALKAQFGEFKKGDVVTPVRFRARLEEAGGDWIVVDSKITELETNPLRSQKKDHSDGAW
jgi:hypothetical protein